MNFSSAPTYIFIGKPGLSPCCFIGTAKQERRKHSTLFRQDRFAEMFSYLNMHLEITSVENILHYFDTPKPQDGEPGFEMNFLLFSCQFTLSTTFIQGGLFKSLISILLTSLINLPAFFQFTLSTWKGYSWLRLKGTTLVDLV